MFRACAIALAMLTSTAGLAGAQGYGGAPYGGTQAAVPGYSLSALQRALQQAGYDPGPADGAMGARTRSAISAYQRDAGLPVTGEPSPRLYARLTGASGDSAQRGYGQGAPGGGFGQGATGAYGQNATGAYGQNAAGAYGRSDGAAGDRDLVADVQFALRDAGYGSGSVTGTLDAETRAAIRAYQRDTGLPVTGEPSRRLLATLQDRTAGRDSAARGGIGRSEVDRADGDRRATDGDRRSGMSRVDIAREVEARLQAKGFTVGPVDGEIDAQTAAAIREYQQIRGYQTTGEASRQLLADLRASNVTAGQGTPQTAEGIAGSLLRGLGQRLQRPAE